MIITAYGFVMILPIELLSLLIVQSQSNQITETIKHVCQLQHIAYKNTKKI